MTFDWCIRPCEVDCHEVSGQSKTLERLTSGIAGVVRTDVERRSVREVLNFGGNCDDLDVIVRNFGDNLKDSLRSGLEPSQGQLGQYKNQIAGNECIDQTPGDIVKFFVYAAPQDRCILRRGTITPQALHLVAAVS
jgi:hypothetical protein